MLLRKAQKEDISAITQINLSNWREVYRGLLSDAFLDSLNKENLRDEWEKQLLNTVVAVKDNQVIGYIKSSDDIEITNCRYIDTLQIQKEYRNQGVGTALLKEQIQRAWNEEKQYCSICIVVGNDSARRVYTKLGFEHYRYFIDEFHGTKSNSEKLILKKENVMFREITRKKQEITKEECIEVLMTEKRGVLSVLGDDDYPYGMPMNFLYSEEDNCIYFHGSYRGHRGAALARNNKASFCVYDKEGYIKPGEWACNVRSVIVFGKTSIVEDMEQKEVVLRKLGLRFTEDNEYLDKEIANFKKVVTILKLDIEHMSGKLVNES